MIYRYRILDKAKGRAVWRTEVIKEKGGKFCINVICGPDEYTPLVDNNCYTNYLTRKHLRYSLETAELLKNEYPKKYARLKEKCGLTDAELLLWKRAADNMYLPYNQEYDMYMQDDQFMYRDPVDLDSLDPKRMPMLFHYHPLNLWRMQVCKQADLVLLMFLCSNEFTIEMKKRSSTIWNRGRCTKARCRRAFTRSWRAISDTAARHTDS